MVPTWGSLGRKMVFMGGSSTPLPWGCSAWDNEEFGAEVEEDEDEEAGEEVLDVDAGAAIVRWEEIADSDNAGVQSC